MQLDFEKLAAAMLLPVKGYIDKAHAAFGEQVSKLSERLARLEASEVKNGRDGLPGRDGQPGKDGSPGVDGKDGLGFDDLDVQFDGERSFTLRFAEGERVKEFTFKAPFMLYRGVYQPGAEYERGDTITWDGSCWVALKDTSNKPGPGEDWQLAVKRGRNGRTPTTDEPKSIEPVRIAFKGVTADG